MVNHKNENIAGVYGFARSLMSIIQTYAPDYLVVALDTGQKTWRHDTCPAYKSNRPKAPPELSHQFQWIRDLCTSCGIKYCDGHGYEADDYIASYVKKYGKTMQIYIFTYDKDLYQLIDNNVKIVYPFNNTVIGEAEVQAKFGVMPERIADLLALAGDNADCVAGVKGIGPKTAAGWIQKYGSLDNIMLHVDQLTPVFRRDMVKQNMAKLLLARDLVSLRNSLEIGEIEDAALPRGRCLGCIKEFLGKIGLDDLVPRFERALG
jgi:DNA polymerase-1